MISNTSYAVTRYLDAYPSPKLITATISNANGTTEENFVVAFIEGHSPIAEGTTSFVWTAQGVDEIVILAIPNADPLEVGTSVSTSTLDRIPASLKPLTWQLMRGKRELSLRINIEALSSIFM